MSWKLASSIFWEKNIYKHIYWTEERDKQRKSFPLGACGGVRARSLDVNAFSSTELYGNEIDIVQNYHPNKQYTNKGWTK